MSLDLIDLSNDAFDDWLRDMNGSDHLGDISEERLVELISSTLREETPQARARGLVDLANLCYAMADKTLGAKTPATKCLRVVVTLDQRH